jgi:hypothetical protein
MSSRHWSPDAELHNGKHAKTYRHDPYRLRGKVFYFADEDVSPAAFSEEPPMGTRHMALWGQVSFVPYPTERFIPSPPAENRETLVRVFVGQLPYQVTDQQLAWLCYTFGGGAVVAHPERIMKRQPNGERLPTGCIHAYTTMSQVEAMAEGMHKRMLVDDTGVWHAQTVEEFEVLSRYVSAMKTDKSLRAPNRPYDSVVVQLATSTFVPVCPIPLSEMPTERKAAAQRVTNSPPPQQQVPAPWSARR